MIGTVQTSYKAEDVKMLLTDLTGKIEPKSTAEREVLIQSGVPYCTMLPNEYIPTKDYYDLYELGLNKFAAKTAEAVAVVSQKIWEIRGDKTVIVSLARAGTPVGILIKDYLKVKYGVSVPHYTVSIIRGVGIDHVAMKYMLDRHNPEDLQFIDGWTGKGAILNQLKAAIDYSYPGVSSELAVLADPANVCKLYGTQDDFLIPSSCLNSTVSGLISRTILNRDLIDDSVDFHGAVYQKEMESSDVSYDFINKVKEHFIFEDMSTEKYEELQTTGMEEAREITRAFNIADINLVKPGIGETTRVLLRRVPWKILVKDKNDTDNIGHILRLAYEKGVSVEEYPLKNYKCVGIIKGIQSDV